MKTITLLRALGPLDLKNVRRDSLLMWIPLIPFMQALLIRSGVPLVAGALEHGLGFHLEPYYPLIVGAFVLDSPATIGMVVGFLLLDERDDHTLQALLVTPMPLSLYFLYRIGTPLLGGVAITLLAYPMTGLVAIPLLPLLAAAMLAALVGPQMALVLASFAANKLAGFGVMKFVNTLLFLPIVAFFLPGAWQLLGGLLPPYWSLKVFWQGVTGGVYWPYVLAGVAVNGCALWLLFKRFQQVVHR